MAIIPDYDGVLTYTQQMNVLRLAGIDSPQKLTKRERDIKLTVVFEAMKTPPTQQGE